MNASPCIHGRAESPGRLGRPGIMRRVVPASIPALPASRTAGTDGVFGTAAPHSMYVAEICPDTGCGAASRGREGAWEDLESCAGLFQHQFQHCQPRGRPGLMAFSTLGSRIDPNGHAEHAVAAPGPCNEAGQPCRLRLEQLGALFQLQFQCCRRARKVFESVRVGSRMPPMRRTGPRHQPVDCTRARSRRWWRDAPQTPRREKERATTCTLVGSYLFIKNTARGMHITSFLFFLSVRGGDRHGFLLVPGPVA